MSGWIWILSYLYLVNGSIELDSISSSRANKESIHCTAVCFVLVNDCKLSPLRVEDILWLLVCDHRLLRSIACVYQDYRVNND